MAMPGSSIQMPDLPKFDQEMGQMLAFPGAIVFAEACLMYHFIIMPRCAATPFAGLCSSYATFWPSMFSTMPYTSTFCLYAVFGVAYAALCFISNLINWSLCGLSLYLFISWIYPHEAFTDVSLAIFAFIAGTVTLLAVMGHVLVSSQKKQQRDQGGGGFVLVRRTRITVTR